MITSESIVEQTTVSRSIIEASWDTLFRIDGDETSDFLYPARLAANRERIAILDVGTKSVTSVDWSGALMWSYGQAGAGPDEFKSPMDVKIDAEGRVWVLDVGNARLTVLSRDGVPLHRISLASVGSTSHEFVPVPNDEAILFVPDSQNQFVQISADGTVLRRFRLPIADSISLNPLAMQLLGSNAVDGSDRWASAFQMGNGFVSFSGPEAHGHVRAFVEHVNFPQIAVTTRGGSVSSTVERPRIAARSLNIAGDELLIHFVGSTEFRARLVDRYSIETGQYLSSVLLPRSVDRLATIGSRTVGIYSDPYPHVIGWERKE